MLTVAGNFFKNPGGERVKGIVHPKMKIWYLSAHPRGIQYVGDFVSSVEHRKIFF